ncbi:MAG: domain containing protein [Verrucomicrobia bacterium]|nr:domain containing protein [Verrucomicrobiota bacterium]
MKPFKRPFIFSAPLALFLAIALSSVAQEQNPAPAPAPAPPPPATETEKATPAAPAPAATETPAASTTTVEAPVAQPAPAETPAAPATEKTAAPKLRRLDVVTPTPESKPTRVKRGHVHHKDGNEIIQVFDNAFLAKDQKADAVVAVFGNVLSEGDVGDSIVAVFGNTRVTGPVADSVVSVIGNTYVNSKVGDLVIAVGGTIELGPDAEVGDVVAIGGKIKRDTNAIVHGETHNVAFHGLFSDMLWLQSWFEHCLKEFRLLWFGPHLMWAWWLALGFLALYVVLALLFRGGVEKCVATLEQRPGFSILTAFLTVLLAPVVTILLICTGVGIAVVPFLGAAIFFAGLFGKAVMLAWLGRRLTRLFGVTTGAALAVLIGGVFVLGIYCVPVLSLVIYKLFGWLGLGVVVYTLAISMKREKPVIPSATPPAPTAPPIDPVTGAIILAPAVIAPPIVATTLPRAGFWIRTAALILDVILVGIILAIFHSNGKVELLALAAYGAVMWKLRGSTIGGIICGLKVVRLDDRPIDWSTSVVRALACFLSLAVIGLGFIWVAFDDQSQSWHDKIAGTTVVRVPKGVSLI